MNPRVRTLVLAVFLAAGCGSKEVTRPETTPRLPPAIDHTWVATDPIQCLGNPWEVAWVAAHNGDYGAYPRDSTARAEIVKDYYRGEGIEIRDLRITYWDGFVCRACGCPAGYTLYLLVDDEDVPAMSSRGYRRQDP